MSLDIVRGKISNIVATKELIRLIEERARGEYNETLYLGYPISASVESAVTVDALLLSEEYGILVFIFSKLEDMEAILEEQGELYFQLINTLTQYPSLRRGRALAFEPYVISIIPEQIEGEREEGYIVTTFDQLTQTISEIPKFNAVYYRALAESLQKIASIKPRKKRENIKLSGSKGDIIKKIEKEIANLDQWKKKAALEITNGPQRIRGLAGSGKTIILALKAAYLHTQYPDWDIVVTYYTRSLWQQYRDLITKFVFEFSRDEPDWDKLHLFHAWGSQSEQGLYAEIARSANLVPVNFANARLKFGREQAFWGICNELNQVLSEDDAPMYDLLLIDEAQDMPVPFFKLAYKCVKKPKRIVWAYDELQNLNATIMPSIEEMFGTDEAGKPLIELKNEPDEPMQDIILPVCYRNPPWVLALAHSLGFGIYRDSQLVQHFDTLELWEDIGYKKEKGVLDFGRKVTLSRRPDATPNYFYDLLKPTDVIDTRRFDDVDSQYDFIARQIKRNISEEELDPDDILVIFPSVISAKREYQKFVQHLSRYSILSILAGVTNERDIFRVSGSITCSAIYRAKGNEAPMVYVVNSEYCNGGMELIKLRNTLFTAITRSRAWVRIYGVGSGMDSLIEEIQRFIRKDYVLDFKIPTRAEMERLRTINKEKSASERKRIEDAAKNAQMIFDMMLKNELDPSQIPGFDSFMAAYLKQKFNADNDEEEP